MAGFMSGHTNYRYDGTYRNGTGAPLYNGMLVALAADGESWKFVLPEANKGKFNVVRRRDVYEGTPGIEVEVMEDDNLFFVENLILINDSNEEWDGSKYSVPDGALVRAHMLRPGEYFVTDELAAEPETYLVGTTVKSAATGKVTA